MIDLFLISFVLSLSKKVVQLLFSELLLLRRSMAGTTSTLTQTYSNISFLRTAIDRGK
jgi:hypothetical protein